jgi:DNA primase
MSDSIFSQIKERVSLEDYLVNHLNTDLVPNGPGRMAALCPFHDELTPSFKVTDSDEG